MAPKTGSSLAAQRSLPFRGDKVLGRIEPAAGAIAHAMNVECPFRDIDADGRRDHLFLSDACHPGRKAPVSVHATWKRKGDQTLTRPVK
ncbi:hypothetical protein [Mesorhizobium sp. 43Arga]